MKPNNNKLVLTEGATKQLQAERMARIDAHLQELGKHQAIRSADLDMVLRGAIEQMGMPADDEARKKLLDLSVALATSISDHKLRVHHEKVKALCAELKVHGAPDAIVWSCRQAGVELFPDTQEPQPT